MRHINLLTIIAILSTGCSKKPDTETTLHLQENLIPQEKLQNRNGIFYEVNQVTPYTGRVEDFYSNGQRKSVIQVKEGKKHGAFEQWHKNGQMMSEEHFKNGKLHGASKVLYKNGQVAAEAHFKNGELNGLEKKWYENGMKKSEAHYQDGKLHDKIKEWDQKGKMKYKITNQPDSPDPAVDLDHTRRYIAMTGDTYTRLADRLKVDEVSLRALNDNMPLRAGIILNLPAKLPSAPLTTDH